MARPLSLFWRVFAVNAGLPGLTAVLLLFTPVTTSAPIALTEALLIVAGLAITLVANALLLRRAVVPLERLAQRMDTVDLLRPGQRLPVGRGDEVGRVVRAFNQMLDRLEGERRRSGRHVLAAQEAERVGIARDLHDEVTVALDRGRESVVLSVVDDGRGFDTSSPDEHGGLRSMRALLVDGALAIERAPGGGVEVLLEVPVSPVADPLGVEP